MKYNKITMIVAVLVLVLASIFVIIFCNKRSDRESSQDFRSDSKTLTSIDAAKYLATKYIKENSVEGMAFKLEEGRKANNWIIFKVIPLNIDTDVANIYLSNNDGTWTVRGFGTMAPYAEKDYPSEFNEIHIP